MIEKTLKSERIVKSYRNFAKVNMIFAIITLVGFSAVLFSNTVSGINHSSDIITAFYFISLTAILGLSFVTFLLFSHLELKGKPSRFGPVLSIALFFYLTFSIKLIKKLGADIGDVEILLLFQAIYCFKYVFSRKYSRLLYPENDLEDLHSQMSKELNT